MIGQKNNINTIIQWRCNKSVPRFIIISGDEGSGRLTLVKVIIKMINAKGIIMGNSIAEVRETIENAYTITEPTCYIFRNADDMSIAAKNALLKVVEEPPNNSYFIMTVQNIDSMIGTIKSRGTVIKMEPYSKSDLKKVSKDEILLEYCRNIGQLQIDKAEIQKAENCVDTAIKAIIEKSGTKLLKACTQLRCKQTETEKIDCLLFMRIFEKRILETAKTYKMPKKLCSRISECKMELLRNSLNRKASIECMLIKILEEFKNAEIS